MAGEANLAGPEQSGQVQWAPMTKWVDVNSNAHPGQNRE
jgi:hypothetical protein